MRPAAAARVHRLLPPLPPLEERHPAALLHRMAHCRRTFVQRFFHLCGFVPASFAPENGGRLRARPSARVCARQQRPPAAVGWKSAHLRGQRCDRGGRKRGATAACRRRRPPPPCDGSCSSQRQRRAGCTSPTASHRGGRQECSSAGWNWPRRLQHRGSAGGGGAGGSAAAGRSVRGELPCRCGASP